MSVFSNRSDIAEQNPPPPNDDFWYTDPETGFGYFPGGVSSKSAMAISAYYRAVSILAGMVGYLPFAVYKRVSDTKRELASDIPEYEVLRKKTNRRQNSNKWRRFVIAQVLLKGNSYHQIIRKGGRTVELLPLDPDRMTVEIIKESGRLKYTYVDAYGVKQNIAPENLLHFMGPTLDGVTGITPIEYCRQSLELIKNSEKSANAFYKNNGQPVGVLTAPNTLSKDAHGRIRDSWQKTYGGPANVGKVAILEEGTEYHPVTMSMRDAQYIDLRKFGIGEVSRMTGVPTFMLGDVDNAHFNNVENLFQFFVSTTLIDILTSLETEIDAKLFLATDYYCKFNPDGLTRGNLLQRTQAFEIMMRNGVLNPNEWRTFLDMNPREDEDGDLYQRPMNMVYEPFNKAEEINQTGDHSPAAQKIAADSAAAADNADDPPPAKPAEKKPKPKRDGVPLGPWRHIFRDALNRVFTKESKRLEAALRKEGDEREEYIRSWYAKHDDLIREVLAPATTGYLEFVASTGQDVAADAGERFLSDFSARSIRSSLNEIERAKTDIRELQTLAIDFYQTRSVVWADAALTLINSLVGIPYESEC